MAGYCVAFSDVRDADAYGRYSSKAPGVIKQFGGQIRIRGGRHEVLEGGGVPARVIMLEFDSPARADAWYHSAEYQEISKDRFDAADLLLALVEGEELGDTAGDAAGYVIVKATITNPEAMKEYGPAAAALLSQFGGQVVANGPITNLEGDEPHQQMFIIKFDSFDAATSWYRSPEYQAIIPLREGAGDIQILVIEGA